jgi:hypothetical protein
MVFVTYIIGTKFRKWWNVDGLGYLRGRYLTPVQALRLGATAIRNCFRDQLKTMRQEGIDRLGFYYIGVY